MLFRSNIYQPLKDVTVVLKVSLEDEPVDETELISLPTLDVGRMGGAGYNYIPSQGWQHGTYIFKIELYSQGKLQVESAEVSMPAGTATAEAAKGSTPADQPLTGSVITELIIIGVIAFLIIGVLAFLLVRRRAY